MAREGKRPPGRCCPALQGPRLCGRWLRPDAGLPHAPFSPRDWAQEPYFAHIPAVSPDGPGV
ncbi:protein of unknown function [Pseudorhizobium banfieldiae]|uniref:Uncharacterized protein n=1 Tax=Pseudorhizobium banfieldiae TaxID=1125847 RepID=L0NE29_9HYPH|nr:protein of unknown function [Pseudorhizobium banfieldiae]